MEIPAVKRNEFTAPLVDMRCATDVSEEFTLADYYPEIKKVISFTARAIPEGKFVSGDAIDCDGIASFNVTYLGEDGTIAAVSFSIRYTQTAALPGGAALSDETVCDTKIDGAACRVTAPRKVSLKAHLTTRISAGRQKSASVEILNEKGAAAAAEAITVEKDCFEAPTVRLYYGAAAGSVNGEIAERSCDRAVSADGVINIIEAKCEEGGVAVKAEAIVTLLCQDQNGLYYSSREASAFEARIPVAEAEAPDRAVASAVVTAIEVNSNDEGLYYELDYDMDVQVQKTVNVTICRDAYSTEFENAVETAIEKIVAPVRSANAHLTQSGEIKRRGEAAQGEYVVSTWADAAIEEVAVSDGKVKAAGTLNVRSAVANDGDVAVEDGKIPFTYVCDAPERVGELFYRTDVQVTNCAARIEGGVIRITAELSIALCVFDVREVNAVSKVILQTDKKLEKAPGVRIIFPGDGESVWSLCKRCAVSPRTLEKLNELPEGTSALSGAPVIVE